MENDSDYLLANGNLSVYGDSTLTAGTVEVKGNFYPLDYHEGEGHKTKFTGDSRVSISCNTSYNSSFANAYFLNPNLYFDSSFVGSIRLACDTVFNDSNVTVSGTLDLNGCSLTTPGTVKVTTFTPSGGVLHCARLEVYYIALNSDSVINGDVDINSSGYVAFNGHKLTVNGNSSFRRLKMENDSDYLLANGNLSVYGDSTLTAGTVEVKGNFYGSYYQENDRHRTIFSGSGAQSIGVNSSSDCYFSYLTLENPSDEGVIFSASVKVKTLFNHNRNHFTLYNSGGGSSFPDYDGDGALDHVDMYPMDPRRIEIDDGYGFLGDADGDKKITILDATAVQRYLASYAVQDPDHMVICGDVNGDGLDIIDATYIQRYLAGCPVPYDIGKKIDLFV